MSDTAVQSGGLKVALKRLAANIAALLETRLELASVELAEERERLKSMIVLLITSVVALAFAGLAATAGVIAYFWDTHRMGAIIGVTVFYAAVAGFALWRMAELRRDAPPPFEATLAELQKDRRWLAGDEVEP